MNSFFSFQKPGAETDSAPERLHYSFWLFALAIVLLSCMLNFGGMTNTEAIDDHDLLHNPIARGCGKNPLDCFRHPQFGLYYRPLMGASFSIGENLHGQEPYGFHIENLLLHGGVVFLALWMFRLLFRQDTPALFAGLFFAVHPLQIPVTTFIGGRTDTLALFFLFWFVIGALQSGKAKSGIFWKVVSLLGFTAALFTKEQCGLLVLLLPLFLTSQGEVRQERRFPWWTLLYGIPIIVLLICARNVIPPNAIDTVTWKPTAHNAAWSAGLRIEMVGRTLNFYARSFLWPVPNALHQSSLGDWDIPQPLTALTGFLAAGVWLGILRHIWPDRRLRALALWTTLTLLPCLNIIPIPSQFVACYRAAIPLLGIAGLAGAAVGFDSRRQEGEGRLLLRRWALPAAMTSFFVVASLADVPAWKNDLAIEKAEYQADPNFLPAVAGWAFTLHREGRANEALPKYNLVLSHFFSENSTPEEKVALTRTPWMLRRVKSYSSLRYQPIDFIGQMFRGRGGTKQMTGRYDDAIQDYRVAFALHPDDYEIADWMTQCYEMNGRFRDAEAHLKEVVARAPNGPRFFSLGKIYYRQGRWLEARNTFAQALAHTPSQDTAGMKAILSWYQRADTFWSIESKPHAPKGQ